MKRHSYKVGDRVNVHGGTIEAFVIAPSVHLLAAPDLPGVTVAWMDSHAVRHVETLALFEVSPVPFRCRGCGWEGGWRWIEENDRACPRCHEAWFPSSGGEAVRALADLFNQARGPLGGQKVPK